MLAEASIQPKLISIGCNRTPNASDCSSLSGRIVFAAHNAIAIWNPTDPTSNGVYATLKGHIGVVNAVKWVPGREEGQEIIVSGAVDHSVRLWKENDQGLFECYQILKDHKSSVQCISATQELLATGSSDGSINLYRFHHELNGTLCPSPDQIIQTAPLYPLCLALHSLGNGFLLAIGGSSSHIHIYTSLRDITRFERVAALKGHEDWIRGLDFTTSNSDIYLSSASQDRYIRLWKISQTVNNTQNDLDTLLTAALGGDSYPFTLNEQKYTITFSALLPGHDDWVFTVRFHPTCPELLLSASADASLIMWRPEFTSGIWIPEIRLGEVSSLKGATTAQGSSGGFWGGLWTSEGKEVACWGKTGGWRIWRCEDEGKWVQRCAISGAVRPVKGISWDPRGSFLLSVSLDQTTRMFGKWKRNGVKTWHEIARPQIHGYDLNAISCMKDWKFVSGADEKVLRVFQVSKSTADLLNRLSDTTQDTYDLPSFANLPVLGLSNKATSGNDDANPNYFIETLSTPPLEDHLSRYTLSPELEKLYAHPSEIIAISASHSGRHIASTCKATTPTTAVIRVFSTETYSEIATLKGHSLTVTKLAWAPDDSYLISVGRDRHWIKWDTTDWSIVKDFPQAHGRIIWDVSVAPKDFGDIFITASRDGLCKVWDGERLIEKFKFADAVTACAFLPTMAGGMGLVAVGLENGEIYLLACVPERGEWRPLKVINKDAFMHSAGITGLAWRPVYHNEGSLELASCGDDCSVRIYEIAINLDL